jgi:hypothetical protein
MVQKIVHEKCSTIFLFNDVAMYTYSMSGTVEKKKGTGHRIVRKAIHSRAFLELTYF